MALASFLLGRAPQYIEFAWITTHAAAGQNILHTSGWITLTLTTKKHDTGNLVNAPSSNQFTLPAGVYAYDAFTKYRVNGAYTSVLKLGLYNISDSVWIGQSAFRDQNPGNQTTMANVNGMFSISSSKTFDLRARLASSTTTVTHIIDNGFDNTGWTTNSAFTNSDEDQRTTIKLWKVK